MQQPLASPLPSLAPGFNSVESSSRKSVKRQRVYLRKDKDLLRLYSFKIRTGASDEEKTPIINALKTAIKELGELS